MKKFLVFIVILTMLMPEVPILTKMGLAHSNTVLAQDLSNGTGVGIISSIAGTGAAGYTGDGGLATNASLGYPYGIALDSTGNIYIADNDNHCIRKINASDGKINTIVGNGSPGFSGDGGLAINASLNTPNGVAVDSQNNIYIVDRGNNRIRKVNASNSTIITVAGNGQADYSGDGGLAINATLNQPIDVDVDSDGNLYIADLNNNRIRKVNASDGKINTVVGNGSSSLSSNIEVATNTGLYHPSDVAVDRLGNLFITNQDSNCIREVSVIDGKMRIIAGNGLLGYSGDGGLATSAKLSAPFGLTVDSVGNLYIADTFNNCIRKVDISDGIISTVAGNGVKGYSGDGGEATSASLNWPLRVAVDSSGSIYIADLGDYRIRKVNLPANGLAVRDIIYTQNLASQDIVINSWKVEKKGTDLEFTVNYQSEKLRNYTVFNPPNGDKFMILGNNAILSGQHTLTYRIPAYKLIGLSELTMKFFETGVDERNFIYFNTNQISDLLVGVVVPTSRDINYIQDFASQDIVINSWIVEKKDTDLEFTVDYQSSKLRNYSVFNPPNGDKFMILGNNAILTGQHILTYRIPIDKLIGLSEVTMKFSESGIDERNFIYFNTNQIRDLIGSIASISIVLAKGNTNPVGGITNVAIPAEGATDTTGAVTGWVANTACNIKLSVVDAAYADSSPTSTITINTIPYTSGTDYKILSASPLTIVVTTNEVGKAAAVRTFVVPVAAAQINAGISGTISRPAGDDMTENVNMVITVNKNGNISNNSITIPAGQASMNYSVGLPANFTGTAMIKAEVTSDTNKYVRTLYYKQNAVSFGGNDYTPVDISTPVENINFTLQKGVIIQGDISLPSDYQTSNHIVGFGTYIKDSTGRVVTDFSNWTSDTTMTAERKVHYKFLIAEAYANNSFKIFAYQNTQYGSVYTYYNSSGSVNSEKNAQAIIPGASGKTGIDITLITGRTIGGTISLPNGETAPAGGLSVQISFQAGLINSSDLASFGIPVLINEGQNSGSYRIALPINSDSGYKLYTYLNTKSVPYMGGYYSSSGLQNTQAEGSYLDIKNNDLSNIDFTLIKGKIINGTISRPVGDDLSEEVKVGIFVSMNGSNSSSNGANLTLPSNIQSQSYSICVPVTGSAKFSMNVLSETNKYVRQVYYKENGFTYNWNESTIFNLAGTVSNINFPLHRGVPIEGDVIIPVGYPLSNNNSICLNAQIYDINNIYAGQFSNYTNNFSSIPSDRKIHYKLLIDEAYNNEKLKILALPAKDSGYLLSYYNSTGSVADSNLAQFITSGVTGKTGIDITFLYPSLLSFNISKIPNNTLKLGDDFFDMNSDSMSDPNAVIAIASLLKDGINKNKAYFKFGDKWYAPFELTEQQFLNPTYALTENNVNGITGFNSWYKAGSEVVDLKPGTYTINPINQFSSRLKIALNNIPEAAYFNVYKKSNQTLVSTNYVDINGQINSMPGVFSNISDIEIWISSDSAGVNKLAELKLVGNSQNGVLNYK